MQLGYHKGEFRGGSIVTADAKVDNPYRTGLQALKTSLKAETEELKKQLEKTSKDMAGKKVWVGSTAETWQQDLDGRRARIKVLADKLIPAVDAAIAGSPEKVTPGEANALRMDLHRPRPV
jgi:hypothetical protein